MNQSYLFRNILVVPTHDPACTPFHGWLAVRDGHIAGVGRAGEPITGGDFDHTIEGDGAILMPGLVNSHAHSHSSLTRGSAEAVSLGEWLRVIEREQAMLTDEEAYIGGLATYGEALLSGTTSIMDMCIRPSATLAAAEEAGIRTVIAPYVADSKPFAPKLDDTIALLRRDADLNDKIRFWVGLHDIESCSEGQLLDGVEIARSHGTGVHLHCAETQLSAEATRARTGLSPIAYLHKLGALGPRTLLAHAVWIDGRDRAMLADAGVHVAHCPHANLKLGSGIADIPALCGRGVNVSLATDGAKANNRLDMFDVMKFASLLHKGVARDPRVLPPEAILYMATCGGAVALGLHGVGCIEPGMAADLLMVKSGAFHLQPCTPETVATNLVHAARGSDVSLVMVSGTVLVQDGQLVRKQHREAVARQRQVAMSLLGRAISEPA